MRRRGSVNVRFTPKATAVLRCRESTLPKPDNQALLAVHSKLVSIQVRTLLAELNPPTIALLV
jgi:hypothetical protein